ncbi:MAG TPA: hypothetical protein VNO21_17885 [Polyangiaceae bacterium]|nr:hypothetical protein [Polyangiaceae bacterium]
MKRWPFASLVSTLLPSLVCFGACFGCAQSSGKVVHAEVLATTAHPEDVLSIDAIIGAMYDVLSGPAGQPRQWSRDRDLYVPDVRFFIMSANENHEAVLRIVSQPEFVELYDRTLTEKGFYEKEIHRETQRFGNMAHVFSTYESRQTAGGPVTNRGINSVELVYHGHRWWIASIVWDDERPDNPIPDEFRPNWKTDMYPNPNPNAPR